MGYQQELEEEYLNQIAASAKTSASGFDPKMLWRYGGWLQPNLNAAPEVSDPQKAFDAGAMYFDVNPAANTATIQYKAMDRHIEQRIQRFVRAAPPPEGLNVVFRGQDGSTKTLEELMEYEPGMEMLSSKTAAPASLELPPDEAEDEEGEPAAAWEVPDPEARPQEIERTTPAAEAVPASNPDEPVELAPDDFRAEVEAELNDPDTC